MTQKMQRLKNILRNRVQSILNTHSMFSHGACKDYFTLRMIPHTNCILVELHFSGKLKSILNLSKLLLDFDYLKYTLFINNNCVYLYDEIYVSSAYEPRDEKKLDDHKHIHYTLEELEELKDDEIIGDLIKEIIEKLKELK